MNHSYSISDFSPHLFLDVDCSTIDFERAKVQIIQQVLKYGRMADWRILEAVYDRETLNEVTTNLRSMNPVSLSFITLYLYLEPSAFKYYISKPSAQGFWNF